MLGEKLKNLRETNGLLQKQVASLLGVDVAYYSRMERNEKPVSKNHLKKLADLFCLPEKELLSLWLADKVMHVINDENCAADALIIALNQLEYKTI